MLQGKLKKRESAKKLFDFVVNNLVSEWKMIRKMALNHKRKELNYALCQAQVKIVEVSTQVTPKQLTSKTSAASEGSEGSKTSAASNARNAREGSKTSASSKASEGSKASAALKEMHQLMKGKQQLVLLYRV